jgi:hypothetical protein
MESNRNGRWKERQRITVTTTAGSEAEREAVRVTVAYNSLAGEGGAKSNALDNFKTKFEEFGRRQSARATATGPSRIPLPPTGAIAEEEDFEASQGKLCISKEQIFDLTGALRSPCVTHPITITHTHA